jgi:hypothetical protein
MCNLIGKKCRVKQGDPERNKECHKCEQSAYSADGVKKKSIKTKGES